MVIADETIAEVLCILYALTLFLGKARILCLLGGWVPFLSSSPVLRCGKRIRRKTLLKMDMLSTQRIAERSLLGSQSNITETRVCYFGLR